MSQHVHAIYENGVLKPMEPLDLPEHARVEVTVDVTSAVAAEPSSGAAVLADQQRALDELRAAIAKLPRVPRADRLTNRDHDQILYGGKS